MKLVFVISSFHPVVGGGEKQAEAIAGGLASRGHEITVLTRHKDPTTPLFERLSGFSVVRIRGRNKWSYSIGMIWWLLRNINKFQLIHAMQSNSPLMVAIIASLFTRRPVVCTPMTFDPELNWLNGGGLVSFRRKVFGLSDLWIAKSKEISAALSDFAPGKVLDLPNAVDTSYFSQSVKRKDKALPKCIYVGRLEEPKRVDVLLRSWEAVMDLGQLSIVGDGTKRSELENMASQLRLRNIEFLGWREDVADILQNSDVFVLVSEKEGMPNALLEAMSCGLACVASRVGAVDEMLSDGTGVVLAENSAELLASELKTLLATPNLMRDYGHAARKKVENRYSRERVINSIVAAYESLM